MKKLITIALILTLTLSLLTACASGSNNSNGSNNSSGSSNSSGSNNSSGNNNTQSGSSNSNEPASDSGGSEISSAPPPGSPSPAYIPIKRDVEVPDNPPDLSDDSTYFVVIDGVRFDLMDITVKDFLNAGFYLDEDEDDENYFNENTPVEPNSNIGSTFAGTSFYKEGTTECIYIIPVNRTDRSIPVKDCEIQQILFNTRSSSKLDIYSICNLSLGSTKEEVISVFGEEYESFGPELTYVDPKDAGGYTSRFFCFIKDSDDIIYEIFIDTNKRVKYDWE